MKNIMSAVCTASFGILLIVLFLIVLHELSPANRNAEVNQNEVLQTEIAAVHEGTSTLAWEESASMEGTSMVGNISMIEERESVPGVFLDLDTSENLEQGTDEKETKSGEMQEKTRTRLLFAGDICIQDYIAGYYDNAGIGGIVSDKLREQMLAADIMMANQEFAFSERGKPMEDKQYTYEIAPHYVSIFTDLGIDIVTLANNHALDYGTDALLDSFDALDGAGVLYVGAGKNFERAKKLEIIEKDGIRFGFLAASRVIPVTDWNAGFDTPGMLTTYDPTALIREIEKGKELCDVLVVYVHWGVERNEYPEEYQKTMARQYIDAGADVVVGTHPHVMQGIEYYKGKPIAYSLGNYIFSSRTGIGAMLCLSWDREQEVEAALVPFNASAFPVKELEQEKRKEFFRYMERISFGISIDEAGRICYTQDNKPVNEP